MRNILINLFSKSLLEEDFEFYSKQFEDTFEVYNYYFDIKEMFPDIIEAIINQIKQSEAIDLKKSVIVFQTNVADLGHFSAKFYSQLIDNVIIIPNKVDFLGNVTKEYSFMTDIIKIKFDSRISKVYLHDLYPIELRYLIYLHNNRIFNDILPLKSFQENNTDKLDYNLEFNLEKGTIKTEFNLQTTKVIKVNQSNEGIAQIFSIESTYGLIQLLKLIIEFDNIPKGYKQNYLSKFIEELMKLDKESREEMICYLDNYLKENKLPLEQFVDYNYICIKCGDQKGLLRQYKYLEQNVGVLNLVQVHALITNSLFYTSRLNQEVDRSIIEIRLMLMGKINDYWNQRIKIPKNIKQDKNKIAIVAGQLLGLNHSPTKLVLDYAKMLEKYNPKLKIKIFVEDWAYYSPDDLGWINVYSSSSSTVCKQIHKEYVGERIDIYYSDGALNRKNRVLSDLKALVEFKPSIIYKIGSKFNVVTDLLFKYFPVVSQSIGGIEESNYVDVFTAGYTKEYMESLYSENNLSHQKYMKHIAGLYFTESKSTLERIKFGFKKQDFIMITVGNRLEAEVDEIFVTYMLNLLSDNENYKWIFVGAESIPLISRKYHSYIDSGQIKFHSYEPELLSLYKICDVYVNPPRKTGGYSGALAMYAGLPVITTDKDSDVGLYVGERNCIDLEAFPLEITKLKEDKEYYLEKSEEMKNRIENEFSFKKTVKDLEKIFEYAIDCFKEREEE